MFFRADEMEVESRERARDGMGITDFVHLIPKDALPSKCRLFSLVCLEKGCSVGRHEHTTETEIYYVVEGEGILNDNGTIRPFRTGDASICGGGAFHSVANDNDETLKIVAVIVQD